MKVIVSAIVVAIVIAGAAGAGLVLIQRPVYEAQPSESVRIGNPGTNLVGPNWTGNPVNAAPSKSNGGGES